MLRRGGRMLCNPNRGEGLVIPTARIEDYLEAVFDEEVRGGSPTVTRLAERLSVTKGTVVPALKKLVEEGLLDHER
jgi:DtxR family Mn-dependent transcriptional regulator